MEPQFQFTVNSEDFCVLCLDKGTSNNNNLSKVSIRKLSSFLKLDYMKIFNIKTPLFSGKDKGSSGEDVDITVTLCKSCSKLKNKFYDLCLQQEWIVHRMGTCIQTMHEVMQTAESNVIRVRKYHEDISGARRTTIGNTIPERFRKEAMQKCQKFTQFPVPPPKMEYKGPIVNGGSGSDGPVKPSLSSPPISKPGASKAAAVAVAVATEESEKAIDPLAEEGVELNGNELLDDDVYVDDEFEIVQSLDDDDDEKDPEELMMQYDSCSSANAMNASTNYEEEVYMDADDEMMIQASAHYEDADNVYIPLEDDDDPNFEIDEDMPIPVVVDSDSDPTNYALPSAESDSPGKPNFSSKYKCNICGKVVVSLKNFELHQRRHAGEKPFECEICQKTFRDTSNLRSHALRYHRHLLFAKFKARELSIEEFSAALECLVMCVRAKIPKPEKSSGEMSVHNPHGCKLCGKQYTQGYVIEDHVVQRHYTLLAKAVSSLQTQICKLSPEDLFQYLNSLQEKGVNDEKSSCGMCGAEFSSGDEVNLHIKSHIKIKVARNKTDAVRSKISSFKNSSSGNMIGMKMKCEQCGKYFDDLGALNKHKVFYKNGSCANPDKGSLFACDFCGRSFNSYYNQRAHIVSFHRYEVFSKYLPVGTEPHLIENGIKSLLQNYRKLPVGTFECGWCLKEITQLRKLNSHVLVTHFEDIVENLKGMMSGSVQVLQIQG